MVGDLAGGESEARQALSLDTSDPGRAEDLGLLASVLLARGMGREALVYATEAHDILAKIGPLDIDDTQARRAYAEALYVTGNLGAAREAIRAACTELLRRASKISNEAWRQTFLERVHEHGRIFALARAWSVEV
jgi:hypothetical protein